MFDRIAGVYDLMNSVMTAGLHHRWRERAVDLAAVGPGRPRARRRHRHRRPGDRAGAARGAGRRGRRLGLLRGDARARAREGAGRPDVRFEWGDALALPLPRRRLRRRHRRLRRAQLLRPRSAGWPRWRASCGPAAASSCSRSPRRASRRCRRSIGLWFDRIVPALGAGSRATRTPTPTCRTRCGASRARRRWPRRWRAPGLRDVRWILTAGGIIAIHDGTVRLMAGAPTVEAVVAAGGAHVPPLMEALEERLAELAAGHGAVLARHGGATIAAGGKRLRPLLVFVAAGEAARPGRAAGRGRGRAGPLRHARPRRRARRGRAAARAADGRRGRRARDGDRDRRPAVLARVRRAGAPTAAPTRCACSRTPAPRSRAASCCSARTPGTRA